MSVSVKWRRRFWGPAGLSARTQLEALAPTDEERAWWKSVRWSRLAPQAALMAVPFGLVATASKLLRGDAWIHSTVGWWSACIAYGLFDMIFVGLLAAKAGEKRLFALALKGRRLKAMLLETDALAPDALEPDPLPTGAGEA